MRKIIFALAASLALAGCSFGSIASAPPPAELADRTALDEQAAIGVELAYKAFRLAAETAVDAGVLKGERAAMVGRLDDAAYTAVTAVRAAYAAGNAENYAAALEQANAAIGAGVKLVKGETL
jgi:hypothetical protein